MGKYHLSNKAVEDLSGIWEYTADTWSQHQADTYYSMLVSACNKIAGNPQLYGINYEEVKKGLYGYRANKHIIFYQTLENGDILVIRILHQRMDIRRHL